MPEYLAPGVYVEETSFRAKSIEGVSTTTTGFVGPTKFGPTNLPPEVVTSLGEFERVYGGRDQLRFKGVSAADRFADWPDLPLMNNYIWHGARAFFEEGGKRLYVSRVFRPATAADGTVVSDGRAAAWLPSASSPAAADQRALLRLAARFPGAAGRMIVRVTVRVGQNILTTGEPGKPPRVPGLIDWDLVQIVNRNPPSPLPSPPPDPMPGDAPVYAVARSHRDPQTKATEWEFEPDTTTAGTALASPLSGAALPSPLAAGRLALGALTPHANPRATDQVRIITLTVVAQPADGSTPPVVWDGLPPDPRHRRAGKPDSLFDLFEPHPASPAKGRTIPLVVTPGADIASAVDVLEALCRAARDPAAFRRALDNPDAADLTDEDRTVELLLDGGNDGLRPTGTDYAGGEDANNTKTGLVAFEDLDDISIVAAPGATFGLERDFATEAQATANALIAHAQRMRYRIAVLDSGDNQSVGDVRRFRAKFDSSHAALYYPWVRVLDPVTNTEVHLPPSGFVAGIYARNDITRAVYKAPANEVVTLALGFEKTLNKAQQEVLNPEGVNCFRFFEGRGYRLWGARTTSSDPEWKYVNLRRYFAYLEHSVDKGTQYAVFEPNGDALWANVRRTIEDFLLNEWQSGALLGDKPEKAYFVRCDRSTMTQNDLDNGRLVCLIGVAPLRPAEFVIFRIGQFTADRKG